MISKYNFLERYNGVLCESHATVIRLPLFITYYQNEDI